MLKWLKRFFIPHVGNAYRPHFLLNQNIRQLLGIIFGFELILFILPTLFYSNVVSQFNLASVLPAVLSTLTNAERLSNNLPILAVSPKLTRAAQLKAEDMAAKSYFAHTSPEGKSPWHWFNLVGYRYYYAGENLAVNFTDSKEVAKAWMNSPTHRANIVGGHYTEIGTGIATGKYKGNDAVFVAQLYASPFPVSTLVGQASDSIGNLEFAIASPRDTANTMLIITLAVIFAALLLNIFIKFDRQHPDLIRNGLFAVVIILGIYLTNSYLSEKNLETSFIAFSAEETIE